MDLERVATGYVVTPGIKGDDAVAAMEQADATVEGAASALFILLEGDLLNDAEDNAAGVRMKEEAIYRCLGPWSLCKRVSILLHLSFRV